MTTFPSLRKRVAYGEIGLDRIYMTTPPTSPTMDLCPLERSKPDIITQSLSKTRWNSRKNERKILMRERL
eukprot:583882-Amorphochlora_amoeboformis.AAC.1